jgi:regulator of replication initiation timing
MAKKKTDMVIANPLYDVVFKNLMTIIQEEYWATQNEIIWGNQVETLTKENTTLSNENVELRRLLQQAVIAIPSV